VKQDQQFSWPRKRTGRWNDGGGIGKIVLGYSGNEDWFDNAHHKPNQALRGY